MAAAHMRSTVALLKCSGYDLNTVQHKIEEGLELIGGVNTFIKRGEKILLKPNLLASDPPETATTTHPVVFEAVAHILLNCGVDVYYGDSPAIHSTLKAVRRAGLHEIAERLQLKIADFDSREKIFFETGAQNKVFEIAKGVLSTDGMVSLPKLKTHGFTLLTGAIKNQFGCIPGLTKSGFHAKLENLDSFAQMLVDLTMFLKPRLYIMDGIWAMEGNGPRRGKTVNLGVLLISADPVALDTVASQIIDLDPNRVLPTVKGAESGLGSMNGIEVKGDKIADVKMKFALPRYSGNLKSIPPFFRGLISRFFIQYPVIDRKKCIKCHECYKICPTAPKSIRIRDDKFPEHVYKTCIRCYCCQETCPESAITIKLRLL